MNIALRPRENTPAPSPWTRWYWPGALTLSLAAFFGAQFFRPSLRGNGLILGMIIILIPEISMAVLRLWQNTFSDWVWNALHVARNTPITQWNAEQFLTFGAYSVIAASVDTYVFHLGITAFMTSLVMSVWLAFHFFFRWWA